MERMSPLDAMFLHVEDGVSHMHIAFVRHHGGAAARLRRLRRVGAQQVASDPPLPPARPLRAGWAGPAGVGRRSALPPRLPRPPHRPAAARFGRRPPTPHGPADVAGTRPQPAAVGDLAGRGAGGRHVGAGVEGAPLHGRRDLRDRPDGGRARHRTGCRGGADRGVDPGARADRPRAARAVAGRHRVDAGGARSVGAGDGPPPAASRRRGRRAPRRRPLARRAGSGRTWSCRSKVRSGRTADGRGPARPSTRSSRCDRCSAARSTTSC